MKMRSLFLNFCVSILELWHHEAIFWESSGVTLFLFNLSILRHALKIIWATNSPYSKRSVVVIDFQHELYELWLSRMLRWLRFPLKLCPLRCLRCTATSTATLCLTNQSYF